MTAALRWTALALAAALALQAGLVARIALMAWVDPQSTAFQRSALWRAAREGRLSAWQQQWVADAALPDTLRRAVVAAEDSGFARHRGLDLDAIESAWSRNARAQERAANRARHAGVAPVSARVLGGSTITQQLAKNLFLSGERTLLRKGQEAVLAVALELLLGKRRILALYLNSVEWGDGIFGAEAAARHYFHKPAAQLTAREAARLAVMLPRPRYWQQHPQSPYLASRAATIAARMAAVELP